MASTIARIILVESVKYRKETEDHQVGVLDRHRKINSEMVSLEEFNRLGLTSPK